MTRTTRFDSFRIRVAHCLLAMIAIAILQTSSKAAIIPSGDVSPAINSDPHIAARVSVGQSSSGSLIVDGGSSIQSNQVFLGSASNGNVTIRDPNSHWSNSLTFLIGRGILRIENGGSATTRSAILGAYIGSDGSVIITGPNSTWNATTLMIGAQGIGTLRIENGGRVVGETAAFTALRTPPPGVNVADVRGPNSSWELSDRLLLTSAGPQLLNIEQGGAVTVGGVTQIGSNASSSEAIVDGFGSTLDTGQLVVGSTVSAVVDISNGATAISNTTSIASLPSHRGEVLVNGSGIGSTFTNVEELRIGDAGNGRFRVVDSGDATSGSAILGNAATATGYALVGGFNARWTNNGNLIVGNAGVGELEITNAGEVTSATGVIGQSNTTTKSVATVDGLNSVWTINGSLTVGNAGYGEWNVERQATASSSIGLIGNQAGSMGTANVVGFGTEWTNSAELTVGNAGQGTLNITSGVVSNTIGVIGNQTGSTGAANLIEGRWNNSGSLTVGNSGNGVLDIRSDARVTNTNGVIAEQSTSTSSATVNGINSSWVNSGDLTVGLGGHGTLNVENESKVSSTNGVIGSLSNSTGIVNVGGANSIFANPEWNLSGTLTVGSAGGGTLNISDQGRVQNQAATIADLASSIGIVNVTGDRSSWNMMNRSDLTVGRAGNGTLNIEDDSSVLSGNNTIAADPGSIGVVKVTGAGTVWDSGGITTVGKSGHGTLTIENQGIMFLSGSNTIADQANSTGIVNVSGAGTRWVTFFDSVVGNSGNATLNISAGGETSTQRNATIGLNTGSTGVVNVTDPGTNWFVSNSLLIGGDGDGTLNIHDGGKTTIFSSTTIGTSGNLRIGEGQLETRLLDHNGNLIVELSGPNGLNSADPLLKVNDHATLAGTITVDVLAGFTPELGDTFEFLTYSSRSGSFSSVIGVNAPAGLGFKVDYDDTLGVATLVTVQGIPEPSSYLIAGMGFLLTLLLQKRTRPER